MARAHYIHVITNPDRTGFSALVGVFTVKHEMETFIEQNQLDMKRLDYNKVVDGKGVTYSPPKPKFTTGCSRCGDSDPSCICYAR